MTTAKSSHRPTRSTWTTTQRKRARAPGSAMTDTSDQTTGASRRTTISVDAMGGDRGPAAVLAGIETSEAENRNAGFIVNGPASVLQPLIDRRGLGDRCVVRDVSDVVTMDAKPSHVMRNGKGTSMWSAVDAVKDGEADAVVSCGNTGALMAVSMIRLRKLEGVDRPAIACLWPSRSPEGFNIMLDVGADIRADARDLLQYALMGGSYARNGLGLDRPRIGLLNVGTEEHKGRSEIKEAHDLITEAAPNADFDYIGFVEGGDIPSARVDVIVTDGFTGNVALKTGEGTASLIREFLREAFKATPLSRIAALLGYDAVVHVGRPSEHAVHVPVSRAPRPDSPHLQPAPGALG